jgi:hypothetical protein
MEDQLLMMLVSKQPVCSAQVQLYLAASTTHPQFAVAIPCA